SRSSDTSTGLAQPAAVARLDGDAAGDPRPRRRRRRAVAGRRGWRLPRRGRPRGHHAVLLVDDALPARRANAVAGARAAGRRPERAVVRPRPVLIAVLLAGPD